MSAATFRALTTSLSIFEWLSSILENRSSSLRIAETSCATAVGSNDSPGSTSTVARAAAFAITRAQESRVSSPFSGSKKT